MVICLVLLIYIDIIFTINWISRGFFVAEVVLLLVLTCEPMWFVDLCVCMPVVACECSW